MPSINYNGERKNKGSDKESLIKNDVKRSYGSVIQPPNKAENYNGNEEDNGKFFEVFRFANKWDICLMVVGTLAACVTGAGSPFMSTIFGDMSNTFLKAQHSFADFGSENQTNLSMMTDGLLDFNSTEDDLSISKDAFLNSSVDFSLRYVYLGIVIMIAGCIQAECWLLTCERQINRLRRAFFQGIMRQDIAWFDRNQSGGMVANLSDNLERIKEGVGDKFGMLIQFCVQFIAGFVIAFIYNWKMTLVMMSITPVMAGSAALIAKLISTESQRESAEYGIAGGIAEEVFSCIRTVMQFNGQNREISRYADALKRGKSKGIMKAFYNGLSISFIFICIFGAYGLAFWYGSTLIASGEIDRGVVFTVFSSVMMGSMALGNAAPQLSLFASARGAARSIFKIIDREPDIDAYSEEGRIINNPRGRIVLKDAKFSYPVRKDIQILKDINFKVDPGETVALVGSSGSGKSTIVNLILRYYDLDEGQITIDGIDIKELNVHFLRSMIGVVSQEPVLFGASIEENIRYGNPSIRKNDLIKAAKQANAHEFVSALPRGYDTKVGERGAQLSGGQKQRIAIARALVRDPKILLLDEATSALDSESESVVQEALEKAQKGRTTIIIAHRLSTIKNADKIIAMKDGAIVEAGSHDELMKINGLYSTLVNAQTFNSTDPGIDTMNDETDEELLNRAPSHRSSRGKSGVGSAVFSVCSATSSTMRKRLLSKTTDTDQIRLEYEAEQEGVSKASLSHILSFMNLTEWITVFIAVISTIVRGCVFPAFALFYSQIFDVFSKTGQELTDGAIFWAIMFALLGVINGIACMGSLFLFGVTAESVTMRLRRKVFANVVNQDVKYFDDPLHDTGKLCTRLATDAPNIKKLIDYGLPNICSSLVTLIAGVIIGFIFGWKMSLLVVGILPFSVIGFTLNLKISSRNADTSAKLLEEAGKIATEGIDNMRTVQSLTQEKLFYDMFCANLELPYRKGIRQAHAQALTYGIAQGIMFFIYAAAFRFGAYLIGIGDMTPTNVYRVFFALSFSSMSVAFSTSYLPEYLKARFSAALLFKMMTTEPEIDINSPLGLTPSLTGNITLNSVYFAYPQRSSVTVLQGINLLAKAGETLALVGPSGCGKSTVISLLQRFYDPLDGQVIIDDYDLRTLNLRTLRSQLSVVSQEPILFDCTIAENIKYGREELGMDKVIDAAKQANIHNFVTTLPQGYETRVGEKGTQLSGGQKQRVAIARALIRDPKLLLLDEATSALDTESEKIVQDALDQAAAGRTCIIIAHRLTTVQNADKIAVVKQGKVVELGTHLELLAKQGDYYNLVKRQNLNKDQDGSMNSNSSEHLNQAM